MKHNKYGTLSYNDNGEYEIDGLNISKLLHDTYYLNCKNSDLPNVTLKIETEARKILNESGQLYLGKDKFGNYSWFIDDMDIEDILFNLVDEVVDITIIA